MNRKWIFQLLRISSLFLLFLLPAHPAWTAPANDQTIHFKGAIHYIVTEGTYGILSDDGKKYQPIRLPREFRKDSLAVVVDAKLRRDLVGARMWGPAIEITAISKAEQYISPEDKIAIQLLLTRMDAFNSHNLAKLQAIDVVARGLSTDQFLAWIGNYGSFTLRYVDTVQTGPAAIEGICLYSRELINGFALSGNQNLALTRFTLNNIGGGWKFTDTGSYPLDPSLDRDQFIHDLLNKSQQKFGTTDLAQWVDKPLKR